GGRPLDVPCGIAGDFLDAKLEFNYCAAWPAKEGGSLLQAYVRNRTLPERRTVFGQPDIPVDPLEGPDADLEGSRIALFGCPVEEVLPVIEALELEEGLPHPTLEGEWAKTSPEANQS